MHTEEHNPERELAFRLISETNTHLFLTGKAGTGKTTFLNQLRPKLSKRMAIVAPTGIAALNAKGVTIHSFFGFPFGPLINRKIEYKLRKEKIRILRSLDLLVIDEISMVRADLLDAIDKILRHYRRSGRPFGGVQLLIGDLQQLPPIATADDQMIYEHYQGNIYFTASHALRECVWKTIELRKIYRQQDEVFIRILNAVRNNQLSTEDTQLLNQHHDANIFNTDTKGYICLMPTNQQAEAINQQKMDAIEEPIFTYTAQTKGVFPESAYPMPWELALKKGTQVMFSKNDSSIEKRYVNGLIGEITDLNDNNITVYIAEEDRSISVGQETWIKYKYSFDEARKEIIEEQEGVFIQIPLRPAWAITIHKSQGLTFDKAIIDTQNCFAHGQAYVALSRCRSLEGLVLTSPISHNDIKQDKYIRDFYAKIDEQIPQEREVVEMQKTYFLQCLDEMFKFEELSRRLNFFVAKMKEVYSDKLPGRVQDLTEFQAGFGEKVLRFVPKFVSEYYDLVLSHDDYAENKHLQSRLTSACAYFCKEVCPLYELLTGIAFGMAAKDKAEMAEELCGELQQEWLKTFYLLNQTQTHGFALNSFLENRLAVVLGQVKVSKSQSSSEKAAPSSSPTEASNKTEKESSKDNEEKTNSNEEESDTASPAPQKEDTKFEIKATLSKTKKENPKTPKEKTEAISLQLYREGKSVEEIAKLRGLTLSTIQGHMAINIAEGLVPMRDFVTEDEENLVRNYLEQYPETTSLKPIFEHFEEKIGYGTLKCVFKLWKKEQQEQEVQATSRADNTASSTTEQDKQKKMI